MRVIGFLCLIVTVVATPAASAAGPKIQVVNFTADWCPVCRIFDPRLESAIETFDRRDVEVVRIDLTVTKTGTREQKDRFWAGFYNDMRSSGMMVIHKGYNGYPYTGYAAVIAADTKEPIVCFKGTVSASLIRRELEAAIERVVTTPPGQRRTAYSNCPDSFIS